mmetsp:Transcript_45272/g.117176  ORF Transcript_45272/g.117176 Transcript_45272/m.117176 type:complete len:124 (+) Transcript_45272:1052-1423(+)
MQSSHLRGAPFHLLSSRKSESSSRSARISLWRRLACTHARPALLPALLFSFLYMLQPIYLTLAILCQSRSTRGDEIWSTARKRGWAGRKGREGAARFEVKGGDEHQPQFECSVCSLQQHLREG